MLHEDNKTVSYEVYHKNMLIAEFNSTINNIDQLDLSLFQIKMFKTTNNCININFTVPTPKPAPEHLGSSSILDNNNHLKYYIYGRLNAL
jgi:hypothetical protein